MIDNKQRKAKRAEAQALKPMVHVGKDGASDAIIAELDRHLKAQKLVKVRLLAAATEGGADDQAVADALAEATGSHLIDRRGHTAVYWRP